VQAHRAPCGGLVGKLNAHADQAFQPSQWPGFPGSCDGNVCVAETASFRGGFLANRGFAGTAGFPNGATCDIAGMLAFTSQGSEVGTFICRDAAGAVLSSGTLDIQLIRALGHKNRRRYCSTTE
jgi:hypothetical protein